MIRFRFRCGGRVKAITILIGLDRTAEQIAEYAMTAALRRFNTTDRNALTLVSSERVSEP